jgi:uncharacterized protein (DUF4213/DUF364 family)
VPMSNTSAAPVALIPIEDVESELRVITKTAGQLLETLKTAAVEHVAGDELTNLHRDIKISRDAAERALEALDEARYV